MRKFVLAAASLAALAATPAFAQSAPDNGDKAFNGPRVGVLLGYDRVQPGQVPNSDIDDSNSASGLTYGGDVGYDVQTNSGFVFGVEGEITGSTGKVTNNPSAAGALGYGRVKAGRDLYGGVRIGYAVAPHTLIYAKGGYTNQRLDLVASDGTTETGRHFNLDGWRAGVGLEQSLGGKAYAKLEYRYSNYGQARLEFPNGGNTDNFSVDTDRHQLVAGLGIRF